MRRTRALRGLAPGWVNGAVTARAIGRSLYRFLRELDERGCDLIIASAPAQEGLGAAIANRLLRAAGPRDDSLRPAFDAAPATPAVASAESGG